MGVIYIYITADTIATDTIATDTTATDTTSADTTSVDIRSIATADNWLLQPNPASSEVVITSTTGAPATVAIVDLQGRTLLTHQVDLHHPTIDVTTLPQGIHFVRITANGSTTTRKLVVATRR